MHILPKGLDDHRAGLQPRLGSFRPWVGIANESDQVTKGHLVDALAVRGDEGRGTLR